MSGMLRIHGAFDTSSQAVVYSVSAFGAVTSRYAEVGYYRIRTNCPIGARVPSGAATLVMTRRVISMVTSG